MNPRVRALGETVLRVKDLERVKRFYTDVIGLDILREFDGITFLKVSDGYGGHTQIIGLFHESLPVPFPKDARESVHVEATSLHHFALEIDKSDFDAELARLRHLGVDVTTVEHRWCRWRSLYVHDPEGNRVGRLMPDSKGFEVRTPNLGGRRGVLSDWITQRWVQLTGKSVEVRDYPWLEGPVGDVELIGSAFFRRLAEKKNLEFVSDGPGRGLIDDFSRLNGPACSPSDVDARVIAFYENTADFEFDVWSEWCGAFRPFGGALAAVFSRRLQQLNVPLSPFDTKLGITSDVVQLKERSGQIVYTAWVRDVVSTKRTLYAGSYSVCSVPGYPGPCVKVVFPLPSGSAMVIMCPESGPDGSFTVRSAGVRFGDPGFYFFVEKEPGRGWVRYVRALQEGRGLRPYAVFHVGITQGPRSGARRPPRTPRSRQFYGLSGSVSPDARGTWFAPFWWS